MTFKSQLLAGVRLTDNERRLGRLIRDGEGHPAPAPTPAPAPASSEAPSSGEEDDFSAFEASLEGGGEDDLSGDDIDPAPSGDDDDDAGGPPASDDDKGASVQKRIDELTAAQREAERALAEERRETERLRRELEAKGKPEGDQPKVRQPDEAPNPDDYEFGEADSKYIRDLAEFTADQRFQAREREAAIQREVAQVESTWKDNITKPEVAERYPDFDEKVTKGADRGDWDLSPLGVLMVKSSEVGADVAYHLASNPAESKAIAAMNPFEQAQAIGRLEGRFLYAQKPDTPPAKIASDAPPPPQQRSRGAGGKFQVEADTDDFAAFDKMADSLIKR